MMIVARNNRWYTVGLSLSEICHHLHDCEDINTKKFAKLRNVKLQHVHGSAETQSPVFILVIGSPQPANHSAPLLWKLRPGFHKVTETMV